MTNHDFTEIVPYTDEEINALKADYIRDTKYLRPYVSFEQYVIKKIISSLVNEQSNG